MEENAAGMGMNRSLRNLNYGSKRQELLEKLREMIIGGDFPPGSRFPSYGQLAARVNTGKATLQYVIERLKESGFLIGVERRGLFIPEQLPCFRNFAILLQDTDEHENRFWEKLFAAALAPGRDFHFIAFRGMRDGVVFTNKRIFAINVQGITGKKKDFTSLPYSKIQAFSVETAGTFDLDSELELWFSSVGRIRFEFTAGADIARICSVISQYAL